MPTRIHLVAVIDLQDRVIDSPRAQIADSLKRRSAEARSKILLMLLNFLTAAAVAIRGTTA
jgi:hypothetical protein